MSLSADSGHWSAIARTLVGHRESERSEKGHGENRRKNICRCYGHIPNWLTGPNESHKERHDCERKANNHDDAEKCVHVRARYQLASHRLNPSGPLGYLANTASKNNYITYAVNVSKKLLPSAMSFTNASTNLFLAPIGLPAGLPLRSGFQRAANCLSLPCTYSSC